MWIRCDEEHLGWSASYVRAELRTEAEKAAVARSHDATARAAKAPYWCSAASVWRVRYCESPGSKPLVKSWYVARTPEESFGPRTAEAKAMAETFLAQLPG